MTKKSSQPKRPATQRYLDIAEVRDDVIVMKDGTLRAVVLVSSVNFALKSHDEQEAIIQAYMQFLNGLEYPVQVTIQSRRMNIDDYIARMQNAQRETTNELLRNQMTDYIQFIRELVAGGEIMSKRFYLVVPYDPISNKKKGFLSRLGEVLSPASRIRLSEKAFTDRAHELEQRVLQTLGALNSMGLSGVRLDTQGLIELAYTAYNPILAEAQPIRDLSEMQVDTRYGF